VADVEGMYIDIDLLTAKLADGALDLYCTENAVPSAVMEARRRATKQVELVDFILILLE
jgi:hypothetical protein